MAAGGLLQKASVAEHLKLLADLIPDMTVAGVESGQLGLEGVDVVVGEGLTVQRFDTTQHVECPASLLGP